MQLIDNNTAQQFQPVTLVLESQAELELVRAMFKLVGKAPNVATEQPKPEVKVKSVIVRKQRAKNKRQPASYYKEVGNLVKTLRVTMKREAIASDLNLRGYKTPAGQAWTSKHVENFIRNYVK